LLNNGKSDLILEVVTKKAVNKEFNEILEGFHNEALKN
jgi:hypothetical protein